MKKRCLLGKWTLIGAMAWIAGCGGGGWAGIDGSGQRPELLVSGPINGFGSVIVNGVRYDTSVAEVYVRGQLASEQDLRVGGVVTVLAGTDGQGQPVAYEVRYQPSVTGEIQWVDAELRRFAVLGQVVELQEDTLYGRDILPRNIAGLRVGMRVSVSGSTDEDWVVRASRVEADVTEFAEVMGSARRLDLMAREFYIQEQKVRFSGWMATPQLREGSLVVVRGALDEAGVLIASELDAGLDYRQLQGIRAVELSGWVRSLTEDNEFRLDTVPVKVTQETRFIGGDLRDLQSNRRVRVVGAMGTDNRLAAAELEYLSAPDMQVFGVISHLVPDFSGGSLLGWIWLQNNVFEVRKDTRLSGDEDRRIKFHDLRIGDTVYVSGYQQDKRTIATSLVVDSRDMQSSVVEMQGWIHSLSRSEKTFMIFDTPIVTRRDTYYSWGMWPMFEHDFYNAIRDYSLVKVRGILDGNRLVASYVQIPDPWWGYQQPVYNDPNKTSGTRSH